MERNSWPRPMTMISDYDRSNRASGMSQPPAVYIHHRVSHANNNINETPDDFMGVDVGNSYFMPRRELFVVNADSESG